MKLSFNSVKDPDFIFEQLSNTQKFVAIHPVISRMQPTGSDSFLVYETLKFGPLPFYFTYPATVEADAALKKVVMRATVFKLVHVAITFLISGKQGGAGIEETIHFRSVLPVKFFMQKVFREQHTQLFRNLEQLPANAKMKA